MDSLMAVELRNRINRAFGGQYTAASTVVFDYPDIEALAGFLASEIGGPPRCRLWSLTRQLRQCNQAPMTAIAIIGMACRFPGAENLDAFWQLLLAGGDAVVDARPDADSLGGAGGSMGRLSPGYRRAGFVDDHRRVRRPFLPRPAHRGADYGPAATHVAGDDLARTRRRRHRPG